MQIYYFSRLRNCNYNGANVDAINQKGETILHICATYSSIEVVKLLLEKGANVNINDNENDTPLYRAVLANCKEIIELLLLNGATKNIQSLSEAAKDKILREIINNTMSLAKR